MGNKLREKITIMTRFDIKKSFALLFGRTKLLLFYNDLAVFFICVPWLCL